MVYEFNTWSGATQWQSIQISVESGYKFQWTGRSSGHQIPQRMHAAFRSYGWKWPGKRITVLSASDHLEGSDLALAVAVLMGSGQWKHVDCQGWTFYGEVDLFGRIKVPDNSRCPHPFPHSEFPVIVPMSWKQQLSEAEWAVGVSNLQDVKEFLEGGERLGLSIKRSKAESEWPMLRLSEEVKRFFLIVATGAHPSFMVGPPGTGKTLMARLWWKLSQDAGSCGNFLEPIPPRGENCRVNAWIEHCAKGFLFMDEIGEWPLKAIESLRKPLEEAQSHLFYAAASNPCPCGFLGHSIRSCTCSPNRIQAYQRRFSAPFLDRFHLFAYVHSDSSDTVVEWSEVRYLIQRAQKRQLKRGFGMNGQLPSSVLFNGLKVKESAWTDLRMWQQQLGAGERAVHSVLRVARTIADLEDCQGVYSKHVREAARWHWSSQGITAKFDPLNPGDSWST